MAKGRTMFFQFSRWRQKFTGRAIARRLQGLKLRPETSKRCVKNEEFLLRRRRRLEQVRLRRKTNNALGYFSLAPDLRPHIGNG